MRKKKVTMQSIADVLGISKVSVSKAVNKQPGVGEDLRKSILETAEAMGYPVDKQRRKQKNVQLAFIITKKFFIETDSFYSVIYYSLQQQCAKESIALSLHIISSTDENNLILPDTLAEKAFDGMIIAGSIEKRYIQLLQTMKKPIVLVDFYYPLMELDQIIVDNYDISYEITNYLINLGHQKIGFMGTVFTNSSITDRYYGYLKALQEHGLEYNRQWHLPSIKDGTVHPSELISPDSLPSAFVCHCDRAAYLLTLALHYHRIKIPEAVSILSFDNTELAEQNHPPLSSVNIDKEKLARLALDMIKWRIEHPGVKRERVILRGELIVRKSVAPFQDASVK